MASRAYSFDHAALNVCQDSVRCEADVFHEVNSFGVCLCDEQRTTGVSHGVGTISQGIGFLSQGRTGG